MTRRAPATRDVAPSRRDELRRALEERRRALVATIHERMRVVRAERGLQALGSGVDDGERSEVDVQDDIALSVIQMRGETLIRIDEAIARLEAGTYGQCSSCGDEIATPRLRALPFAVRCRDCEEEIEAERQRARLEHMRRQTSFMGHSDVEGSLLR